MDLVDELPTVLFPIETSTREFDSKIAMASALASRGFRSIVGHKEPIKWIGKHSKRIVWQGKSIFSSKSSDHLANFLAKNDSPVMFIHDEGGIHQVSAWAENVVKKHRVDDLRNAKLSRICVWGERQKEVLSAYAAELRSLMAVTGSPRFDLCRPAYGWLGARSVQEIQDEYPHFILMCTRFSNATHSEGQGAPFRRRMDPAGWPKDFIISNIADVVFSQWHRALHDFADFVVLAKEIANCFPNRTLVLRPHPSESLAFYEQAFAPFKNVVVTRKNNVLYWIRAADLVIHSNCTTGIEAVLAGKPVLNLLPACPSRADFDLEVAREAGVVAISIKDAMEKTCRLLREPLEPPTWSTRAKEVLNNLKSEAIPLLVEETVKVAKERGVAGSQVAMPRRTLLRDTARHLKQRLTGGSSSSYAASKRAAVDEQQVARILEGCRGKHEGGGRIQHLTPEYVVIAP